MTAQLNHKPRTTALHRHLREANISQRSLARMVSISENRASRLCRNDFEARPEERAAISEALGVDEPELWPWIHLGHLDDEGRRVEALCDWLKSSEGRFLIGRLLEVLG